MYRRAMQPRADWPARLDRIGLTYHSLDGGYWREDAAYEFSGSQIDCLESATASLHRLCVDAVERIIRDDQPPISGFRKNGGRASLTRGSGKSRRSMAGLISGMTAWGRRNCWSTTPIRRPL
jgi:hypothetical protein